MNAPVILHRAGRQWTPKTATEPVLTLCRALIVPSPTVAVCFGRIYRDGRNIFGNEHWTVLCADCQAIRQGIAQPWIPPGPDNDDLPF